MLSRQFLVKCEVLSRVSIFCGHSERGINLCVPPLYIARPTKSGVEAATAIASPTIKLRQYEYSTGPSSTSPGGRVRRLFPVVARRLFISNFSTFFNSTLLYLRSRPLVRSPSQSDQSLPHIDLIWTKPFNFRSCAPSHTSSAKHPEPNCLRYEVRQCSRGNSVNHSSGRKMNRAYG